MAQKLVLCDSLKHGFRPPCDSHKERQQQPGTSLTGGTKNKKCESRDCFRREWTEARFFYELRPLIGFYNDVQLRNERGDNDALQRPYPQGAEENKLIYKKTIECSRRAARMLRAFVVMCWQNDIDFDCVGNEFPSIIGTFAIVTAYGFLEKLCKQFCCWPQQRLLGSEELREPWAQVSYKDLFGKHIRRFIISRFAPSALKHNKTRLRTYLWSDAFNRLKRCSMPVSESFEAEALMKHSVALSTPNPPDRTDQESIDMKQQINEVIDVLFDECRISKGGSLIQKARHVDHKNLMSLRDTNSFLPSSSACFESSRTEGGALGELWRRSRVRGASSFLDWILCDKELVGATSRGVLIYSRPVDSHFRDLLENIGGGDQVIVDDLGCPTRVQMMDVPPVKLPCRAVPIIEPFKVRVITKGPAQEYYFASRFQKAITSVMKRSPIFRTLKGTLDEKSFEVFKGYKYFGSVDYSAATDGLCKELSAYVVRSIAEKFILSEEQVQLVLATLLSHDIHYKIGGEEFVRQQEIGQLMGSHVSFPVLCILNLSAHLYYYKQVYASALGQWIEGGCVGDAPMKVYRSPVQILDGSLPLLVNGDDCLFGENYECDLKREIWKRAISLVGFTPSPGKNHYHNEAFTINSMLWYRTKMGDFSQVRAPRIEHLWNESWRKDKEEIALKSYSDACGLGKLQCELFETCPYDPTSEFISCHKKTLERYPGWFIPSYLGGVGMRSSKISIEDRLRVAGLLRAREQGTFMGCSSSKLRAGFTEEFTRIKNEIMENWYDEVLVGEDDPRARSLKESLDVEMRGWGIREEHFLHYGVEPFVEGSFHSFLQYGKTNTYGLQPVSYMTFRRRMVVRFVQRRGTDYVACSEKERADEPARNDDANMRSYEGRFVQFVLGWSNKDRWVSRGGQAQ